MEMQVDGRLIRFRRERRAWSQEHLATVAGLGLRTVQRIETTGLASYESIRAVAAVLEIPVSELTARGDSARRRLPRLRAFVRLGSVGAAAALALVGVFLARSVLARDVMLTVGLAVNDEDLGTSGLVTADGKDAELHVDDSLRVLIVPTIRPKGFVLLELRIYLSEAGHFVLASQPKLVTPNASPAEVRLSTAEGNTFGLVITPRIR
jgi:transcriptional regulator with XRE-family HTH domain